MKKWYEKAGYRIIKTKKGWIIKCLEWWTGPFNTFEEAKSYIAYLW